MDKRETIELMYKNGLELSNALELRNDKDVVLAAVRQNCFHYSMLLKN